MTRLLHILGIHDWVPHYVSSLIDKRMIRVGSICTVCGKER
jgi:hypothetical protein